MKTICFIVPYFTCGNGNLPKMFKLWLKSCGWNSTVNWIVFTDCKIEEQVPKNVRIIQTTFESVKEKIQNLFSFKIVIETPYKICDFRVTYGEAFSDYLSGFDFWGYCDIDLIWGDIRKFFTNEVLENYDRVLTRGHCSIFRNNQYINSGYRTLPTKGCMNYKKVFTSTELHAFDEWAEHNGGGYSKIQQLNGITMYDQPICADIQINRYQLHTTREENNSFLYRTVYEIKDGTVVSHSISKKTGEIVQNEWVCVHLQQRKLEFDAELNDKNYLIVPPNKAIDNLQPLTKQVLLEYTKNRWWSWNLKGQIKMMLVRVKKIFKL